MPRFTASDFGLTGNNDIGALVHDESCITVSLACVGAAVGLEVRFVPSVHASAAGEISCRLISER